MSRSFSAVLALALGRLSAHGLTVAKAGTAPSKLLQPRGGDPVAGSGCSPLAAAHPPSLPYPSPSPRFAHPKLACTAGGAPGSPLPAESRMSTSSAHSAGQKGCRAGMAGGMPTPSPNSRQGTEGLQACKRAASPFLLAGVPRCTAAKPPSPCRCTPLLCQTQPKPHRQRTDGELDGAGCLNRHRLQILL